MYIDTIEAKGLITNLRKVLLFHWTKDILSHYYKTQMEDGSMSRTAERARKSGASGSSSDSIVGYKPDGGKESSSNNREISLSATFIEKHQTVDVFQPRNFNHIKYRRDYEDQHHGFSFLQEHRFKSVVHVEVEFVGAIYLGCWHQVTDATNTVDPDNRLVRFKMPNAITFPSQQIHPYSALARQSDYNDSLIF